MLKRLLVTAIAAALAVGMGYADQSKAKVTIPVSRTRPPVASRCMQTIARHVMAWTAGAVVP